MCRRQARRFALLAAAATALLSADPAPAQTVQVFDEAPPIELLRSIMIPESHGGASRSIVLAHPDPGATQGSLQPSSARMPLPAQPSPATPARVTALVAETPHAEPAHDVRASPPAQSDAAAAGAVGIRIKFAFDSDVVPPASLAFIERISTLLQEEKEVKLRIEGHTDAVGADDYNLDLSKRRALSVARYLVDHEGIAPERIVVVGKGKTEPLTADPYDPGNRRVQFVRID